MFSRGANASAAKHELERQRLADFKAIGGEVNKHFTCTGKQNVKSTK